MVRFASPHLSPDVVDEEEGGVGADPEEGAAAERLLGRPVLPVRRGVAPANIETVQEYNGRNFEP